LSNKVTISKVVEANSVLELLFFLKEPLLSGIEYLHLSRNDYDYPAEFYKALDLNHYYWVFENNTAYSISCYKWYNDNSFNIFSFKNIRTESINVFLKYIIDNAKKIDKMYKMKAFL